MNKPVLRTALFYSILAGGFILVDLFIDLLFGDLDWLPHLSLAVLVVLTSFILLSRAMETRRRAEAILRQARDEMEIRVRERTAELESTNEILKNEIAERQQAEQERERSLAKAEQARQIAEELAGELGLANGMLHTLIETLPAGMVITDADGKIVLANPLARVIMGNALTGITSTMKGYPLVRRKDGSILPFEELPLNRALQGGETTTSLEALLCHEEGDKTFILMAASPVRDDSGRIVSAVEIVQDITHLKQMEQALQASEETARALMNASFESALLTDTQGIILAANETAAKRLGVTVKRMVGSSIFDFFPPEVANRRRFYLDQVLSTGQPAFYEDERDGKSFDIYIHPVCDADGKIIRLATFGQDVTEHKQVEQTIRASEEKFATVFHFSPDAIGIIRSADGTFLDVNDAFTKQMSYSQAYVIGKNWTELNIVTAPDERKKLAEFFREKRKVADYEFNFTTQEGNGATVLLSLIPITISGEACILAIAHEITERKQAEEALRQVQNELALGIRERTALEERQRLARELHDSVSQALYGISLGAHTALTVFDIDRSKVLEALNYVLSLAEAGLTEMRALIFELRPESLELEGLVAALNKQSAALRARHGIEIELSLGDEPDVSLSVKEVLYRVTQEALQNAVKHALPDRVDVRLRCEPDSLWLEVCDNGVGFDPLAAYPGHLGLRSMRERVMSVGGTLEIVSAPDCGTQIRVKIPIQEVLMASIPPT